MTGKKAWKVGLLSDFNISNLASLLKNSAELPEVQPVAAPFGQLSPTLMGGDSEFWEESPEILLVWTRPEMVCESFNQSLAYSTVGKDRLLSEVDSFCHQITKVADGLKAVLLPCWTIPSNLRGLGLSDLNHPDGISRTLLRMNSRLVQNFESSARVFVLDAWRWLGQAGKEAFHPKLWYLSKTPYHTEVFRAAAVEIKAALRALQGLTKKLVIVDLDDTLWGGIVGEVGWQNLRLGGHDAIGEAYADFQKALKDLTNRGILLGIASKNEEATALEAITNHPEMVLSLDDFAGWQINWNDKAQNIVNLVADLNLGLDSAIFLDDNPVERARVQEALPEVLVPDWPESPFFYTRSLLSLNCFDTPSLSSEDRARTGMYVSERKRIEQRRQVESLDDWLKKLNIRVRVESLNKSNLERATQLLNKTNQMNLRTRRMTQPEFLQWADKPGNKVWTFRVSDKFGDSGLTGIASLTTERGDARIIDFLLSCRVMGRRVEEAMLGIVLEDARSKSYSEVLAQLVPTERNKPCLQFLRRCGSEKTENLFSWSLDRQFNMPDGIKILHTDRSELELSEP